MCDSKVNILGEKISRLPVPLVLMSFIGTATDALTRIFLLIPVGLYSFFSISQEAVYYVFIMGAVDSYIEDVLVVIVSLLVGIPLIVATKRILDNKSPFFQR